VSSTNVQYYVLEFVPSTICYYYCRDSYCLIRFSVSFPHQNIAKEVTGMMRMMVRDHYHQCSSVSCDDWYM